MFGLCSCDVNNFSITRSQRRVVQNMNRFINENIKPDEATAKASTTSTTVVNARGPKNLNDWLAEQSNTNAKQLIRHILTNDTRRTRKDHLPFVDRLFHLCSAFRRAPQSTEITAEALVSKAAQTTRPKSALLRIKFVSIRCHPQTHPLPS